MKNSKGRSTFVSLLGLATDSFFATLFPSDCRLCNAPLDQLSRLPVCGACLDNLPAIAGPTCATCGERVQSPHARGPEGDMLCGLCRRLEPPYRKARAWGSYDGNLRGLIHLLKYEQVWPAARVLGGILAQVVSGLAPQFGERSPVLVPVPLHVVRQKQRGFNQAEVMARAALEQLSRSPLRGLDLNVTALCRRHPTPSQTGLTRHQRRQNVRGAFEVARPEEIAGRDVLLVDDVFTTGATVAECARVLRRKGAGQVFVATVARVMQGEVARFAPTARQA
ncbi:MAG: ComF family protein [Terriglobales bacterium]